MNREQINKILDSFERLPEGIRYYLEIKNSGLEINIWPGDWYTPYSDNDRHKVIALLTPFVGKLEKIKTVGTDIDFIGEIEGCKVQINRADVCKIVGYKVTTTAKPKMVATGDIEIIEERQTITDCDIKSGKFSEADITVMP